MPKSYVKPRKARKRLEVRISSYNDLANKLSAVQFGGYRKPGSLRK